MKRFLHNLIFPVIGFAALLVVIPIAQAYVASSTSYRLQSDSVNTGGILSTSTSYRVEDTIGEEGVGTSSSANFRIKAGYQQMQEVYLAISTPGNITLSPGIPTAGGGVANGSAIWTVTTDNPAGYTMNIRASGTPALQSGANNFANYTPAGADPDFAFSVAAAAAEFGFTPEGANIVNKYRDNSTVCNAGVGDTASACWGPLTTTAETIVTRTTPNHPSGTPSTVRFRAESGASNVQPVGSYTATATLTVLPL